jgi:hypothetical protein
MERSMKFEQEKAFKVTLSAGPMRLESLWDFHPTLQQLVAYVEQTYPESELAAFRHELLSNLRGAKFDVEILDVVKEVVA